jgi:hypothetical protein
MIVFNRTPRKPGFRPFLISVLFGSLACFAPEAGAQQTVGVVTALKGAAQLTRAGSQSGLRFKDGLVLRDTVDTREQSLVRILFGGKSTLTVRELSRLEVREESLPTGATRTTHTLSSGGALVHVVRQLLRPGDEVQIQTPNGVAAVRGTTIFVRYTPASSEATFTVLSGSAVITAPGLAPVTVTAGFSLSIVGTAATGFRADLVQITQAQAEAILTESEVRPALQQQAGRVETVKQLAEGAAKEQLSVSLLPCAQCQGKPAPAGAAAAIVANVPVVVKLRPLEQSP